jgi:hypothetical protein
VHKKDWTQASSSSSVHARLNHEAELASRRAQQAIDRDISIIASGVEKHALPGSSLPSARYRQVMQSVPSMPSARYRAVFIVVVLFLFVSGIFFKNNYNLVYLYCSIGWSAFSNTLATH